MNRLLIVAALLTVLSVLIAGPALAQQEREEITVLIPLKYMSAATAAQIFGGTVISPMPYYGQGAYGARNTGGVFGGSHYGSGNHGNSNYGSNSYGNGNYGSNYGSGSYGVGSYQSGQNVGGYGSRSLDLGRSYRR